jgi:formylglycine-generating enzyme required for sulfatase activity
VNSTISIDGIDLAISGLGYRNPHSPKYRLIHAVRQYYSLDRLPTSLTGIDATSLISKIWETTGGPNETRSRLKNFNSLKSSVNADLKRLFETGENPEGIIIGSANAFVMSSEAKDQFLSRLSGAVGADGSVSLQKITEVLSMVRELLSEVSPGSQAAETQDLKRLIKGLSEQVGLQTVQGQKVSGSGGELVGSDDEEPGEEAAVDLEDIDDGELFEDYEDAGEVKASESSSEEGSGGGQGLEAPVEILEVLEDEDDFAEAAAEGQTGELGGWEGQESAGEPGDEEGIDTGEEAVEDLEEIDADDLSEDYEDVDEAMALEPASQEGRSGSSGIGRVVQAPVEILEVLEEEGGLDAAAEGPDSELAGSGDETSGEEAGVGEGIELDEETAEDLEDIDDGELFEDYEDAEELEASESSSEEGSGGDQGLEAPVEIVEVLEDEDDTAEGSDGELPGSDGEVSGEEPGVEEAIEFDEAVAEDLEEIDADDLSEDYADVDAGTASVPHSEMAGKENSGGMAAEVGLPFDREDWDDYQIDSGQADSEKNRLLAERFDGYLGAMERFYNQYLLISAGRYVIGSNDSGKDFQPEQRITLPDVYMGKYPVTNGLFEVFIESTGYRTTAEELGYGAVYTGRFQKIVDSGGKQTRLLLHATYSRKIVRGACWFQPFGPGSTLHNKRNHPVVQVSVKDALAFATWTGKRLATEAEWEAAARTADGFRFPWGNRWMDGRCNVETAAVSDTTAVNQYPEGANSAGISDTLGNVLEWTSDVCDPLYPVKTPRTYHIAKGGSWISSPETPLFSRFRFPADFTSNTIGFRCLAD